jgi:hypothetical protein
MRLPHDSAELPPGFARANAPSPAAQGPMSTFQSNCRDHASFPELDGANVARWLFEGPVQLPAGKHVGAVAGTIDADGRASYVYPEIAGYYLQWLAWRAQRFGRSNALTEHASAVQRWLRTWLSEGDPPPTRVHLDGVTDDWRNAAVFFFDLAMVLRGLGAAARAQLIDADPEIVADVARHLAPSIGGDGCFDACVANTLDDHLPDRWSTRRGAFLAKAAAGVLTAADALPGIPANVARAAAITFEASVDALDREPHRDAHPLLYAFEGVLALPRHPRFSDTLRIVALQFDALLAHAATGGLVPETLGLDAQRGPFRIDVQAQTLRVGHLLALHLPHQPPDRVALERLRHLLLRQVRPTGAVAFTVDADATGSNVWAAMFTDQALAFAPSACDADNWWRNNPLLV